MNKMNCIIVDDEPLAANVLEKYIGKLDHLHLLGKAENAVEAFNLINSNDVKVMFLDMKMPQISGIEFLRSLSKRPAVIFTTAYRDFALDGFELDAVDYLLKPISFERFMKAVSKIQNPSDRPSLSKRVSDNSDNTMLMARDYIFVREDKRMKKVMLENILFIESIKDYVKIITKTGSVLTYLKMGHLEQHLPVRSFIRVHKSFIIHVNAIESYGANEIEIADTVIPIGRHYKQAVRQTLDELML